MIFLGYPNWNSDLPMSLYTFLESYDFAGKTIVPFVTHGGSGALAQIDTDTAEILSFALNMAEETGGILDPTAVYFGESAAKKHLKSLVASCGKTALLACGGGSVKKNGVYDELKGLLTEAGKEVVTFSGIMSNPTYAKVQEGAKPVREHHVDFILAVGGGSVIDCCKVVSAQAALDEDIWAMEYENGKFPTGGIPMGAVVTTSGTGADMNNMEARGNLMWDSAMAENGILKVGRVTDFQAHQIEHQLGAYTDCNHGQGLAVIHPAYYRRIVKDAREKFARLGREVFGVDGAEAAVYALADFIKACGLPTKLTELRPKVEITPALLRQVADTCNLIKTGPRQLSRDEIYDLLMECL